MGGVAIKNLAYFVLIAAAFTFAMLRIAFNKPSYHQKARRERDDILNQQRKLEGNLAGIYRESAAVDGHYAAANNPIPTAALYRDLGR